MTKRPSQEEFDLVVEAIRSEYKNRPLDLNTPTMLNMPQSLASQKDRGGTYILLEIDKHAELKNISQNHIRSIISRLELLEKTLQDKSPRTYTPSEKPMAFPTSIPNDPSRLLLKIFDSFDNWYDAYQFKKNRKLQDMPPEVLRHIYDWVSKINVKFEFDPHPDIVLIEKNFKGDGLDFLVDKGIMEGYRIGYRGSDNEHEVHMTIDVQKFIKFKSELEQVFLNKSGVSKHQKDSKSKMELPPDTKWQDITIQFKDRQTVNIKAKDKTYPSNYEKMGFEDKRTRLPDKQWELLLKLAEQHGEISWQARSQGKNKSAKTIEQFFGHEEDEAEQGNRGFSYKQTSDNIKKTKQTLAHKLKAFFGIKDDPFLPYRKEAAYKIKITLIPA